MLVNSDLVRDLVPDLSFAPTRAPSSPQTEITKLNRRRRSAAAAPPRRLERVGLLTKLGEPARASRA